MNEMEIRVATLRDVSDLAELMEEWGHPTSLEDMHNRFAAIQSDPSYQTWVATTQGNVIGMIAGQTCQSFAKNGMNARIIALVVHSNCRGKGTGKALVQAFEKWAVERNAESIQVNSRHSRTEAHDFYQRLGYTANGIRFVKKVTL